MKWPHNRDCNDAVLFQHRADICAHGGEHAERLHRARLQAGRHRVLLCPGNNGSMNNLKLVKSRLDSGISFQTCRWLPGLILFH